MADAEKLHDADESLPSAPAITWRTRRKMAVASCWAFMWASVIVFFTGLWPWDKETREFMLDVYQTFTMGALGVIFAYIGSTTLPFIGRGWNR